MNHFRRLGTYDRTPDLAALLAAREGLFLDETWRQENSHSPHAESETIFLRMPSVVSVKSIFFSMQVADRPVMHIPHFREAVAYVADAARGRPARAMIVRLKPRGRVAEHTDHGVYADATDRYHLPICTNPGVRMHAGGEIAHLAAGEVWWFDKAAPHAVANDSDEPRIHLVVDVFK